MRIGIDVGGTTVKIGYVENHKIINKFEIKTKKETLFLDIYNAIKDAENVEFIGFGFPGHVKDNYIDNLPNVGLKDIDVSKEFGKYFKGVKIMSTNDANAAALGEVIAANKYKSSYFITLGTGVGGGYIYNGKIVNGFNANAGEIGHMFIDYKNNFKCSCGRSGCLETVSSATGITRLAMVNKGKYETTLDFDNLTCKDVFDKAKEGDKLAVAVVDEASKNLGIALANIAVTCDVECFIIGGGVSRAGEFLVENIKKHYLNYCHYASKDIPIVLSTIKNDAGLLGASYLDE